MKNFTVTIEALKRTTKVVEASSEDEAKQIVQNTLMEEGVGSFEFDEMYDNIKIVSAAEVDEQE